MIKNKEQIIEIITEPLLSAEKYKVQEDIVKEKAAIAVNIMDELISINAAGLDKGKFDEIVKKNTSRNGIICVQEVWMKVLCNEKMEAILEQLQEMDNIKSDSVNHSVYNSGIVKYIFWIYEQFVDRFNDEKNYCVCANFLLVKLLYEKK